MSTQSKNFARSTTKAPRSRTRARTRIRERPTNTTIDSEGSSLEDDSEKTTEVAGRSRVTAGVSANRRGSARFAPANSGRSRGTNSGPTVDDEQTSVKSRETSGRRSRRPYSSAEDSPIVRISSNTPARRSKTRVDLLAADTFDDKPQRIKKIRIYAKPSTVPTPAVSTEEAEYEFKDYELPGSTESPQFVIEVTEPAATTESNEEETLDSLQTTFQVVDSQQGNTSPFEATDSSWLEIRDTTMYNSGTTEYSFENELTTVEPITDMPTTIVYPKRRKVLLLRRRQETSTSSPVSQSGYRRKVVKRLRPVQHSNTKPNSTESIQENENTFLPKKKKNQYADSSTSVTKDQYANDVITNSVRRKPSTDETEETVTDEVKESNVTPTYRVTAKPQVIRKYLLRKNSVTKDRGTPATSPASISKDVDALLNKRKGLFVRRQLISKTRSRSEDEVNAAKEQETSDADESTTSFYENTTRFSRPSSKTDSKDSASQESEDSTEKNDEDEVKADHKRLGRTRFGINDIAERDAEESTEKIVRSFSKRPTTTEESVAETLIPNRKFDYFADAAQRGKQLHFTETSTAKPSVTRLVTSVVESATTERQKISVRKKYSSLTSTSFVSTITIAPSVRLKFSKKEKNNGNAANDREQLLNEIPREFSTEQSIDWSTLPIESEFADRRFTTESSGDSSSTIEIESVFSNLIAQ